MRFRLTIEYTGTRYSGWQIQKNARTVQGELAAAIRKVSGRAEFELYGAGRTDAGVHALGQVAHLEIGADAARPDFLGAVNDALPSDVHVLAIAPAPARFHARHDAVGRSYLYQISTRRTAFAKPFVWWVRDELSLDRMDRAARRFVGLHDFRSFADKGAGRTSTKVLVEGVSMGRAGDLVLVRFEGSHFLWKMVRRMVGVLADVGRGRLGEPDVERFLESHAGEPAKLTAPPSGLFLERVFYEGEARHFPLEPTIRVESPTGEEVQRLSRRDASPRENLFRGASKRR